MKKFIVFAVFAIATSCGFAISAINMYNAKPTHAIYYILVAIFLYKICDLILKSE